MKWLKFTTEFLLENILQENLMANWLIQTNQYICGIWRFFEGQGLRARLCCRKISDSIFWLHCFIPRWLASAMPCPKKVPKEMYKKKGQKEIRDENISFILSFIYLVTSCDVGVVPKTPDSKIVVVGSTDTAWMSKIISSPFSRAKILFFFTHASSPFPLETSGSFFKFNSFLFIYLFIFF